MVGGFRLARRGTDRLYGVCCKERLWDPDISLNRLCESIPFSRYSLLSYSLLQFLYCSQSAGNFFRFGFTFTTSYFHLYMKLLFYLQVFSEHGLSLVHRFFLWHYTFCLIQEKLAILKEGDGSSVLKANHVPFVKFFGYLITI
jgi:hypothetical protein